MRRRGLLVPTTTGPDTIALRSPPEPSRRCCDKDDREPAFHYQRHYYRDAPCTGPFPPSGFHGSTMGRIGFR